MTEVDLRAPGRGWIEPAAREGHGCCCVRAGRPRRVPALLPASGSRRRRTRAGCVAGAAGARAARVRRVDRGGAGGPARPSCRAYARDFLEPLELLLRDRSRGARAVAPPARVDAQASFRPSSCSGVERPPAVRSSATAGSTAGASGGGAGASASRKCSRTARCSRPAGRSRRGRRWARGGFKAILRYRLRVDEAPILGRARAAKIGQGLCSGPGCSPYLAIFGGGGDESAQSGECTRFPRDVFTCMNFFSKDPKRDELKRIPLFARAAAAGVRSPRPEHGHRRGAGRNRAHPRG